MYGLALETFTSHIVKVKPGGIVDVESRRNDFTSHIVKVKLTNLGAFSQGDDDFTSHIVKGKTCFKRIVQALACELYIPHS